MGNEASQPTTSMDNAAMQARQQQLQELQDISCNYLEHLELIIDSRNTMHDPRDVIMVLKSNLKTARAQIEKISAKLDTNSNNNSPLPTGAKKTSSNDSPQSKSQKLQLQPTDSDSTVGSSFLSKFPPLNNRFAYDWSNASIEQIYFDQCKLGKINSICLATSTYDPVIMATISQDGYCRIWKLRQKSKHYEILKSERKTHQVQLFEIDDLRELHTSRSIELKAEEHMANIHDNHNHNHNHNHAHQDKKRNSNNRKRNSNKNKKDKKQKNNYKESLDSDIGSDKTDHNYNFMHSSLGSDGGLSRNGSYRNSSGYHGLNEKWDKIPRKELRFELCHEIKLSSTWNMSLAIHNQGNIIAMGGLDTNVTILDITPFNVNDNNCYNINDASGFPNTNNIIIKPKHKKQKSSKKKRSMDIKDIDKADKTDNNRLESGQSTPIYASHINDSMFAIDDKDILYGQFTFWDQYISSIEFFNDDSHIIVGSGNGTVTICNYITLDKIAQWKCTNNADIISIDYLYLEPEDVTHYESAWNRGKSPTIKNVTGSHSPKKQQKKKKKWRFSKKNKSKNNKPKEKNSKIKFDDVPIVADFDDTLNDSDSDMSGNVSNMSSNAFHKMYDNQNNGRTIMILIGTSSTNNNVFIDEYNLVCHDNEHKNKTEKIETLKKVHSMHYKEKIIQENGNNMKFSFCLENKKCECVKFSPNGKYFAVGGEAGKYEIYNRHSMQLIHERYTKDENDIIVMQRRPNLLNEYEKKRALAAINDSDCQDIEQNNNDDDTYDESESAVTCITWINDHSVAVGNVKGEFIYISTILNEYKIRNFVLKEWINIMDKQYNICNDDMSLMNADNIIEEIHEYIGCDIIDNVIETNFGQRTSALHSHPYFEMKPIVHHSHSMTPNTPISYVSQNKKAGLCVSGSWSKVFQGCVLKG